MQPMTIVRAALAAISTTLGYMAAEDSFPEYSKLMGLGAIFILNVLHNIPRPKPTGFAAAPVVELKKPVDPPA